MNTINIWAIIVAAVVSFGIGALWYSPFLFGKEWMKLVNVSEKDALGISPSRMWNSYLIHFIATLVSLTVLAFAISLIGNHTALDGAFIGLIAWLGFIAPIGVSELLWKKASVKLVMIESVNMLISLIIGGAIIGAW